MENKPNVNTEAELQENTTNCIPRYRSWALWLSVFGLLGLILEMTGVFERLGLDSESWDTLVMAIGSILTAFGIVNNPTCKDKL